MKRFSILLIALACICAQAQTRYVGGDISMLPQYEQHNSPYKDVNNKNISDLLLWFKNTCGWNTFRVRLFVNPAKTDPSVCQDLEYVTALGQRIKAAGAYFMLDFHYSDTWVDAGHIQAPEAWKGSDDATMAQHVADYTREVLTTLNEAGATPDFVQVGNEIMYGLCDRRVHPYDAAGDNWDGYLSLLHAGCNAVRELCPEAQIIIHTDRPCNTQYDDYYYNKLRTNEVEFDIIGLSYYPFWHADFNPTSAHTGADVLRPLVNAINYLKTQFPEKRVHVVECAYNFQYWPTQGVNYDTRPVWPASKQGQYNFVKDLVDNLKPLENLDGINYWFPEEAGNGDDTDWNVSQGTVLWTWQNRGFWDENLSSSGHAINRLAAPSGDRIPADVSAPYYMGKFVDFEPQGFETMGDEPSDKPVKMLQNGCLLIMRNNRTYSVTGIEINCTSKNILL